MGRILVYIFIRLAVVPQKSSQLSSDQQYTLSKGKKKSRVFLLRLQLFLVPSTSWICSMFTPVAKFWIFQEAFYCNFCWSVQKEWIWYDKSPFLRLIVGLESLESLDPKNHQDFRDYYWPRLPRLLRLLEALAKLL